jgi:hypothetical protein
MPANRVSRLGNTCCSVPEYKVDAYKLLNLMSQPNIFGGWALIIDVEDY